MWAAICFLIQPQTKGTCHYRGHKDKWGSSCLILLMIYCWDSFYLALKHEKNPAEEINNFI